MCKKWGLVMKRRFLSLVLSFVVLLLALGCSKYDKDGYQKIINKKYVSNQSVDAEVKNIILIIGDGMGENQVAVAKLLLENRNFDLDTYEYKSMMETSCLDYYVTDSAAAATALATGVKTMYQRVGMDVDGNDLKTILDYAEEAGMSTGVVTDQDVTDATPAGFTAHARNRYLNKNAIVNAQINGTMNLLFGLGAKNFYGESELITSLGWEFAMDYNSFKKTKTSKVLVTFSETDENVPPLYEMTDKAIELLSKNEKGFFLMVEAGQIDDSCNEGNLEAMAKEVLMLDKVLRVALNFMRSNDNTIVVVLADHETGGLKIGEGEPNISWFTEPDRYHTPVDVPVYAFGTRSSAFDNKELSNIDIMKIFLELLKIEK